LNVFKAGEPAERGRSSLSLKTPSQTMKSTNQQSEEFERGRGEENSLRKEKI
jgi:hypothetical protein